MRSTCFVKERSSSLAAFLSKLVTSGDKYTVVRSLDLLRSFIMNYFSNKFFIDNDA